MGVNVNIIKIIDMERKEDAVQHMRFKCLTDIFIFAENLMELLARQKWFGIHLQ